MSDELKVTEEKECKCFCKSEGFRKFLTIALGTFVGVYAALSLFAATHRPPMMPPCPMGFSRAPIASPCAFRHHRHHFDKGFDKQDKQFYKAIREQKGPSPFEARRNQEKD